MCITQTLKITTLSLFIIATLSQGTVANAQTKKVESTTPFTVEQIVVATNKARASDGLPVLTINTTLNKAAQMKATDMVKKGYFAHESPTGVTPWYWFKEAGYNYMHAGENLASGFLTTKNLMKGWIDSPTHKANIMDPQYTEIGIGFAKTTKNGKTNWYVVQMFGSR